MDGLAKFENRIADDFSERLLLHLLNDLHFNVFDYSTNLIRFGGYGVQFGKVVDPLNILVGGLNIDGLQLYKQGVFNYQLSSIFDVSGFEYYSLVVWNSELVRLGEQLVYFECQKFVDVMTYI